jgi:hypothetical protein
MIPRQGISQLMRTIEGLPVEAPSAPAAGSDAAVLARELSQAFTEQLWQFRKARDGEMSLFDFKDVSWEKILQTMRDKSPDKITFHELEVLSREHPDAALARWEEVKAAARLDLANGWQAARGVSGNAWERACFLAIREQFHLLWPPRNGVEAMLLDEIAQYEMLRREMVDRLARGSWIGDDHRGKQYAATVEMGRMVERLQRMIHDALRTLMNIRRAQAPPVVQREIAPSAVAVDAPALRGDGILGTPGAVTRSQHVNGEPVA